MTCPARLRPLALAPAALLAGCIDTAPAPTVPQMAPAADGPPFVETFDASVSDLAVAACRAELDLATDGGVRVVGSEASEAATAVYLRVGETGAPWRCLVSADGTNPSILFMGEEGAA